MEGSFLKPKTDFFLVKDETAYEVSFLAESKEIVPRHSYVYTFRVWELDESDWVDYHMLLTNRLHLGKSPLDCGIIAVRSLYELLGTPEYSHVVGTGFPKELLNYDKAGKNETRYRILKYITQRYDILFDKPYTPLEFLGAIRTNPRFLVRQLQYMDEGQVIVFNPPLKLIAAHQPWDAILTLRMDFDSERLEEVSDWVRKWENAGQSDEVPPIVDTSDHCYYRLLDTLTELDGDFAFVLMPFNEDEFPQAIYHEVIKPLVKDVLGINCVIVTEDPTSKSGQDKIYSHMVKSKLIIAEVSTQNPNVMFEFGQSTILEKEFILTCYNNYAENKDKKLAFDYANIHTQFYDDPDELRRKLQQALEAFKKMHAEGVNKSS